MNIHPVVISENIRSTTKSASFGRRRNAGRVVWIAALIAFAAAYFGSRML